MISGKDIIYISSIEWDFLWQGNQEIARRLAEAGNRVLYVENTGVRTPGVRDAARVAFRLKRWTSALKSRGVREVAPNIFVCSPLVLPPFGARWRRALNRRVFLRAVVNAARGLGMSETLIWTYLPTDTSLDLIRAFKRSGVVYYCVADFTQLTPQADRLRETERELVELSDVVFTNCSALANSFSRWNPHSHVFPFGVNLDAFPIEEGDGKLAPVDESDGAAEPRPRFQDAGAGSEMAELAKPIIGYVGGMHRHVDFGLLREMALARPAWSWVFIGALQSDTQGLAELPNVRLLGQKPHPQLAAYIGAFDVCIVPYVNSIYTETVVPTKINEYLALGKPVVSTDIPTVCEFNAAHHVLRTAPALCDEFLRAVEDALLLPKDRAVLEHRRRVAELGDWAARVEAMSKLIEEGMGEGVKVERASPARAAALSNR